MLEGMFNLQRHMSDLEVARAEQRQSAQDLVRLIDTANAPIIGIDAGGLVNEWNQTAARLTGYGRKDAIGQDLVENFICNESRDSVRNILTKALRGEETSNYEISLHTRKGETIHLLLNATTRRGQDNTIEGVIGIGQDITERLEQEAQLRQRVKLEALGGLTGGIAHDFNNLLTIIMGNLSLVETHTEEEKEIIEDAIKAAQDGSELVRSLLAFSRRQRLLPQNMELIPVLSEFRRSLSRILGESIKFDVSIATDANVLFVDRTQFETALLNLCINARDALEGVGQIMIECQQKTLSEQKLAGYQIESLMPRKFISIVIRDNGPGIPEDVMEKVTEPFFTTKDAGQGSGLGLSSVAGFTKQSGGGMRIESEIGQGTCVELLLPLGENEEDEHLIQSSQDQINASQGESSVTDERISVLIVDDEPRIRQVAARWLTREGFEVSEAGDAESALEMIRSREGGFDILFSDIVMPGSLDGRELAREVARLYPEMKIQLATGYDHCRESTKKTSSNSQIPTLVKPYDLHELSNTFHQLVHDDVRRLPA